MITVISVSKVATNRAKMHMKYFAELIDKYTYVVRANRNETALVGLEPEATAK